MLRVVKKLLSLKSFKITPMKRAYVRLFIVGLAVWLAVWLSGNALASINVVALRQTRYVTSQLSRLSFLPYVGR